MGTAPYPNVNHRMFRTRLETALTPIQVEDVDTAYVFAKYGHRNQFRADKRTRYFEHPKAVAWIIIDELGIIDRQVIVEALLHDIAEDSFMLTPRRLSLNFGRRTANGILLLTKRGDDYYAQLKELGTWRELLVKVCDRLHNLRTMDVWSATKQLSYVKETRREILPVISSLAFACPRKMRNRVALLRTMILDRCAEVEATG